MNICDTLPLDSLPHMELRTLLMAGDIRITIRKAPGHDGIDFGIYVDLSIDGVENSLEVPILADETHADAINRLLKSANKRLLQDQ
jgi:hypothetical protein